MAGLVPAVRIFLAFLIPKPWMPGTSCSMTLRERLALGWESSALTIRGAPPATNYLTEKLTGTLKFSEACVISGGNGGSGWARLTIANVSASSAG